MVNVVLSPRQTYPHIVLEDRAEPLVLAWPAPGNPCLIRQFQRAAEWRIFIEVLGINPLIPDVVRVKFDRAQLLYLLAWTDSGLIKAGELAALIALELALMDRYGGMVAEKQRKFAYLLRYMVEVDGLTDSKIPMIARCGGSAVGQLIGSTRPTLAQRRNSLAHGDPFDGLPVGGLLELVRDLIDYAYRGYIAEAEGAGRKASRAST